MANFRGALLIPSSACLKRSQASCVNVSTISLPSEPVSTTTFPPGPISKVRLSESFTDSIGVFANRCRACTTPSIGAAAAGRATRGVVPASAPGSSCDSAQPPVSVPAPCKISRRVDRLRLLPESMPHLARIFLLLGPGTQKETIANLSLGGICVVVSADLYGPQK